MFHQLEQHAGKGDEKQEGHGCKSWQNLFSQGPLGGTLAV